MSTNTTEFTEVFDAAEVDEPVRTKPSIREIAAATTMNIDADGVLNEAEVWRHVVAGDRVPFLPVSGGQVAYHVVTKGEMVKVERFRARADKQRAHDRAQSDRELAQMRREDKRAQREAAAARQAEATRRSALHAEAVARIAAASK